MKVKHQAHSTDVRIVLNVNGSLFAVAQLGPDFLTLRDSVELPACNAELTMTVDGDVSRWPVRLPEGVRATESKARIVLPELVVNGTTGNREYAYKT